MERTKLIVEELTKLNEEDKKKYSLFIYENGNGKKEYEYMQTDDIHQAMKTLQGRREALGDDGYIVNNETGEVIQEQELDNEYMFMQNSGKAFEFIITPTPDADKSVFNKLTHHMDYLVDTFDYDITFEGVEVKDNGETVSVTGFVYGDDIEDLESATCDTELLDTWPEIEKIEVKLKDTINESINIDPKTNDVDDLYMVWIPYVGKKVVDKETMIRYLQQDIEKIKQSNMHFIGDGLAYRNIQMMVKNPDTGNLEPKVPTRSNDDFLKNLDWKD